MSKFIIEIIREVYLSTNNNSAEICIDVENIKTQQTQQVVSKYEISKIQRDGIEDIEDFNNFLKERLRTDIGIKLAHILLTESKGIR